VVDTLVLYYTGRSASIFLFLYFFSICSAGLLMGLAGSLWTVAVSILGLTWLEWHPTRTLSDVQQLTIVIYALNFLLVSALTSFFYSWFKERERRHRDTLGELEQTRLDTQAILDSLNTGVFVISPERHILYSNPAGRALLALSEDASPETVESMMKPKSALGSVIEAHGERSGISFGEFEMVDGNDSARTLGYTLSPLRIVEGNLRSLILLLADLTPMKEAERTERERERLAAVGMLSRDLAHEIRNPLATVRGCVEMIKLGTDGSDDQRYLDLALKESDRLNNLLRDFLAFAQLDNARKQAVDLADFVRQRVPKGNEELLVIDRLPAKLETDCDPDQLGLVIDAILLTLAEWSEGHGEIRLELKQNGTNALRFLLTEKTVPMDYKIAVFQPFSNVNRASHGLALPTALRAVHAHGGRLTLETEAGIGTWFELKL
jgi:two-component system sensor histidine kinase PilS (NtrC family)